jgi:branched-chain amino acid transport system ATP-binding protein
MLEVKHVSKHFGGLKAVENISLTVAEREIVGLIGPNGSGKTTLFNLITRTLPLSSGDILFQGKVINKLSPSEVCHQGISRTHQIPRPFRSLSARQNVSLAYLYGRKETRDRPKAELEADRLLDLVGLKDYARKQASELNDVQCKVLELARSLATDPRLLLLDEILAGLNPTELIQFQELILRIRSELNITIFWCEHIMRVLMRTVDRVICLDYGRMVCEGLPEVVANNPEVIECYLGKGAGE